MGIHEVDWARYLDVESRATSQDHTPLGDPARWGGEVKTVVTPTGVFGSGAQLIRVQTRDPYSRTWQMLGTLSAALDVWASDAASWKAGLEVGMGVGQTTVYHTFDLRVLVALAAPVYISPDGGITRPWVISGGLFARAIAARIVHTIDSETFAGERTITTAAVVSVFSAGTGI
jgi:hypothetical protein